MLLDKYLPRIDFDSYEDFKQNYRVNIPETFNFGFDIIDEWAKQEPEKKALVWCDDDGAERTFTFTEISRLSNQTAKLFPASWCAEGNCCHADSPPPLGILGFVRSHCIKLVPF